MVARHGDFTRAIELTRQMDKVSKTSPAGSLLRARLYSMLGRTRDVASGLHRITRAKPATDRCPHHAGAGEAAPGRARRSTEAGQDWCSTSTRTGSTPLLLQAKALAESGTNDTDRATLQEAAIAQLEAAVAANRDFVDALPHARGDPPQAKRQDRGGRRTQRCLEGQPQGRAGCLALDRDPRLRREARHAAE